MCRREVLQSVSCQNCRNFVEFLDQKGTQTTSSSGMKSFVHFGSKNWPKVNCLLFFLAKVSCLSAELKGLIDISESLSEFKSLGHLISCWGWVWRYKEPFHAKISGEFRQCPRLLYIFYNWGKECIFVKITRISHNMLWSDSKWLTGTYQWVSTLAFSNTLH